MNNYPFNRKLLVDLSHPNYIVSITGQFITKIGIRPDATKGYDPSFDFNAQNPQVYQPDYSIRYALEEKNGWLWDYLLDKNHRFVSQILRAAQVLREEIWSGWDEMCEVAEDKCDYYTGIQAEKVGPKSLRTWIIYSEPDHVLEFAPPDWFLQKKWQVEVPWTWPEMYAILGLWMIDESTAWLNHGNVYKSATWLLRANDANHWRYYDDESSFEASKKWLASRGGQAKKELYRPLINFVIEKVNAKKYKSRRNAALCIAPEVLEKAKELGIPLSEQQAPLTIMSWLKREGLPANM